MRASDGIALAIAGLSVGYRQPSGAVVQVVDNVDLALRAGEIHGLVGESGCGKSTVALSAIGYRGRGSVILGGTAVMGGDDLLSLARPELRQRWGAQVSYVAQNAGRSLDPALTIRAQLDHVIRRHQRSQRRELRATEIELLEMVGLPDPARMLARYPHELSGGQQQRVALAVALACRPSVLILDEPTTGLDVTTQATVSRLLTRLVTELGVAALYVSLDLGLLTTLASGVSVMYGGEIVESGGMHAVTSAPHHPYTRALLAAVPRVNGSAQVVGIAGEPPLAVARNHCAFAPRCSFADDGCRSLHPPTVRLADSRIVMCGRLPVVAAAASVHEPIGRMSSRAARDELLSVSELSCFYGSGRNGFAAVRDVSLSVAGAEALGIVGLSGSGKSTLLRAIAGLHPRVTGVVEYKGDVLNRLVQKRSRAVRREIQIIFQDPGSSLNPRHRVADLILRPIELLRTEVPAGSRRELMLALLEQVRLPQRLTDRYPWELSGGQQQRVAIARAFATGPALILCDEITSALDVSVQATIIELVRELSDDHGTALIFVSHDLAVIRNVADRVIVMRDGEICEEAPTNQLFDHPGHPYTVELLSAIPDVEW